MSGFSNGIILPNVGAGGAPTTGSHAENELWVDSTGALWVCTVAGSPGTWMAASGAGAVPLSTVTTAGDLIVGTGAGAVGRLGVGAAGTVLGGGATPGWTVLPGTLLATQQVASAHTYSVNVGTLTALDTTNATLSLTVPASGNVDIEVSGYSTITTGASGGSMFMGILNHSGGAQLGFTLVVDTVAVVSSSLDQQFKKRFHLTGLTPGALQVDVAAVVTTGAGNSGQVITAGNTGTPAAGTGEPLLIQAFAA